MRLIDDVRWVKNSFMIPTHAVDLLNRDGRRYMVSAGTKFTDTSLGGNLAINPPPQFTQYADITNQGINRASKGMGRKYSELIDDNAQLVHMRFGIPQFNSLTSFFTGFYDSSASILSRTGRSGGIFYSTGRAAGLVVTLPLAPLLMAGRLWRFVARRPSSKFYYMKPTMALYWNAVNGILNGIAVNEGMAARTYGEQQLEILEGEENFTQVDQGRYQQMIQSLAPGIFTKSGTIDVYAVATKTQRLAMAAKAQQNEVANNAGSLEELRSNLRSWATENGFEKPSPSFKEGEDTGHLAYLAAWQRTQAATEAAGESESGIENAEANQGWFAEYAEHASAALRDGGEFVTFRVNHTGEANESFSNSTGESEIASTINGNSASARAKRNSFADGNIGGVVGSVVEQGRQLVEGALDGLNIEGLAAAFGNAYADIPNEWKDSTSSLPTSSYTIELRSPYGNQMSRLMNLWVPLSMLLAAALPKSVGKHSYDAPFLVELYDKGRSQVRMGMIDSISISRGVGNLGWTRDHKPLGINVTFSVVDLTTILHMPINAAPGLFDEDNAYTDYLAVLGSLSLSDQYTASNRLRVNMARKMEEFRSWTSPAKWGLWTADTMPGRVIRSFVRETS